MSGIMSYEGTCIRTFNTASFFGGMILSISLVAITIFTFHFIKAKRAKDSISTPYSNI